jgi:two-component system cell cycle sensor histidine kinase/response regulator CckA
VIAISWRRPAPAVFLSPNGARGYETVLVVEDEEGVRGHVESLLELHGYRLLVAANAGDALAVAEEFGEKIDLLLTDIQMPDMSGRELAQRLRSSRPDMRLLYMSGQNDEDIAGYGVLPSGTLFLPKPFTIAALTERVREVLDTQAW